MSWFRYLRTFCLFLCLLAGQQSAFAQDPSVKTYNARTFYEDNGLASNEVYSLTQGPRGEMWFGTKKGISTFDGLRWQHIAGSDSFHFNTKSKLIRLGDSLIQVSGQMHHIHFRLHLNGKSSDLTTIPYTTKPNDRPPLTAVYRAGSSLTLAAIVNDHLWLMQHPNGKWKQYLLPSHLAKSRIYNLFYHKSSLLLLTEEGLFKFDPSKNYYPPLWPSVLEGKTVLNAAHSTDGETLYLLGSDWVGEWKGNKFRFLIEDLYKGEKPSTNFDIYNILSTRNGYLIFQHRSSVFLYNHKTGTVDPIKLNLAGAATTPTNIVEDDEGNIWIATLRGVSMLSSLRFAILEKVKGLPDNEVSTIMFLDSSSVLIGTNLGLNILQNNNWVLQAKARTPFTSAVHRILDATKAPSGLVYIAGNNMGLGILHPNRKVEWHPLPEDLMAVSVVYWKGQPYIGTDLGKLLRFEGGKFTTVLNLNDNVYFRKLYTDKQNDLLILSAKGLYVFNGISSKHITAEKHAYRNLYNLLEWNGRTLLGSTNGIVEIEGDQLVAVRDTLLRINRPVYALMADSRGRLWAGTDKGVFVQKATGTKLLNYNQQHGMLGQEINRSALVEMPDGRIWIGTDRGLTIYDPHFDHDTPIIPRLSLTSLKADEQALPLQQTLEVDHNQTPLEFGFRAISFSAPDGIRYRYRLNGLEKDWNYSDNYLQNSVRYASLPAGTYQFMIQARLQEGEWSPLVSSGSIRVAPPYYSRWWFIGLIALGLGLIGYATNALIIQRSNEKRLQDAIDEQKKEIKKSESKFQSIWESMDSGVLVINQLGRITLVNPSLCRMFRRTPEQLIGHEIGALLDHSRLNTALVKSWFANPGKQKFELDITVGGFPLHLLITFSALNKLPQEPLLIIGFKDISDKKETEMKNLRLNELLVRQNRDLVKKELELASFNQELLMRQNELQDALRILEERNFELDQFVYKTSHDLRAPIASALGLLNIMRMEGPTQSWPGYIDMIFRSLQKQDNFIKAMLNFSKTARATDNPEVIEFEPLIEQCLNELQFLPGFDDINKRVRVKNHATGFYSDKMKINIILSNILSNSIKYRDPGKTSRLDVGVDIQVDQAQITISDNGIGINKSYVKSIFDMFYRATERSDGSGLGLYIVKQTVERLGGTIEVSSEIGIGSSFKISIPNRIPIAVAKEYLEQDPTPSPLNQP
ncbi:sensor histidine kinase [Cesiribacter andamanensis]|uniref:histidine kinase n=1 Tax=Cesiribacter andamanensis AMV16 TaxID=1279009 RepID=M7N6L2_9BACT|nr:ATP-binding protein [Cesiribacter andamanensis]EMR02861.1 Autoinducer 2 sensor kinase/phosphatase luxQ [Cesiribacter andamanensis AMV16]